MRQSHTTVLERNIAWTGQFETEPYEAGWAGEAIFFARVLDASAPSVKIAARVQVSPDGIHWVDEGGSLPIDAAAEVTYCRVAHFGNWLRVVGELPADQSVTVIVYLTLKE